MEKLMYLVWLPEGTSPEEVRQTMIDDAGARLLALDPAGLSMDLDDDGAQVPPPLPPAEGEQPVSAIVSIWLSRYDDRDAHEAVLRSVATRIDGYLVTESLYHDYGDTEFAPPRAWPDGERSPAVLTCSFFPVKRGTSFEDWIDFWHNQISPMSAEVQPRMRYVRNVIARPITPDAPTIAGIVEEAWPSGEHITDPMLFYRGDGDTDRMNANMNRMITDIMQFIDLDAMRNNTMSEWILKSLIPPR
jgi:hypothetical protein